MQNESTHAYREISTIHHFSSINTFRVTPDSFTRQDDVRFEYRTHSRRAVGRMSTISRFYSKNYTSIYVHFLLLFGRFYPMVFSFLPLSSRHRNRKMSRPFRLTLFSVRFTLFPAPLAVTNLIFRVKTFRQRRELYTYFVHASHFVQNINTGLCAITTHFPDNVRHQILLYDYETSRRGTREMHCKNWAEKSLQGSIKVIFTRVSWKIRKKQKILRRNDRSLGTKFGTFFFPISENDRREIDFQGNSFGGREQDFVCPSWRHTDNPGVMNT